MQQHAQAAQLPKKHYKYVLKTIWLHRMFLFTTTMPCWDQNRYFRHLAHLGSCLVINDAMWRLYERVLQQTKGNFTPGKHLFTCLAALFKNACHRLEHWLDFFNHVALLTFTAVIVQISLLSYLSDRATQFCLVDDFLRLFVRIS